MAFLYVANHSSDHWAVNALLYLAPVIILAVLLAIWSWRKPDRVDSGEGPEPSGSDDGVA